MERNINIALIGNPDCGSTTVFNQMTGGNTHKGNFSHIHHGTKEGPVKAHRGVSLVELPGTYSLSAYSADDMATRNILLTGKPDVIINVIDATAFQRSLYLTLQLMELDIPMVLALNMMDEIEKNGIEIDIQKLSESLSLPAIPICASKNQGIHELIHYAIEAARKQEPPEKIDFCSGPVHTAIHACSHVIEDFAKKANYPLRFCCTKVMEGDEPTIEALNLPEQESDIIGHLVEDMEAHLHTDREAAMADMRYTFIGNLTEEVVNKPPSDTIERSRALKFDRIITNRFLAIPIFICVMIFVFFLTFSSVGELLCHWTEVGMNALIDSLDGVLTSQDVSPSLHALVIDGICAGVGSVLIFIPRIAVLFFCLSILEDSGYTPRVAFVMDKLLRKFGLSGPSIVPMLIGFGCSVPAVLATRSLASKRDRHLTMALIPFMSCSAKLPIYALFTQAFFSDNKVLIMAAIYFTGIFVALICSFIFKKTVYKGDTVPFVMVLPNYRIPAAKSVLLRMWVNVKGFIKKAFTVVLIATIVIWFLQSFDSGLHLVANASDSMLATIGKHIAPIFEPLGFGDWRAATAVLTGLSAKEAVVSTIAVLVTGGGHASITAMLTSIFSPLSAFAFVIFCLLYMPCVATLAVIRKEMGHWHDAIAVVLFQTAVAWIVAFIIYNVGNLFI